MWPIGFCCLLGDFYAWTGLFAPTPRRTRQGALLHFGMEQEGWPTPGCPLSHPIHERAPPKKRLAERIARCG